MLIESTTKDGSKKSKLEDKNCPYYKPSLYSEFNIKLLVIIKARDLDDIII